MVLTYYSTFMKWSSWGRPLASWDSRRGRPDYCSTGIGRVKERLRLRKNGQLCAGWIPRSTRSIVKALGIFGARRVRRCVRLLQCGLPKARGAAFVPSRYVGRVLFVCVKIVSTGTMDTFRRCSGSLEPNFNVGRRKLTSQLGKKDCKVHINKEAKFDYMEEDGDQMWAKRRRVALDVWLGWIVAQQSLEDGYEDLSRLLKSGESHLVAGKQCSTQCTLNNFEVRERKWSGYLTIATCSEQSSFLLLPASQTYVFYSKKRRDDLACSWYLEAIWIPPNYLFADHSHLQHTGPKQNVHHALWCHIYIIPND